MNEDQQSFLREEYFKLIDMLQGYDSHFVSIKSWSASASSAALGLSFFDSLPGAAFIASLLALSFWLTEARFKVLQLSHINRASVLEEALRSGTPIPGPSILLSFGETSSAHGTNRQWRRVMTWPQVMFPHVAFFAIGVLALLWQLFHGLFQ